MNIRYFKRITSLLLLIFAFCSFAEAGQSASRSYRMSVTVPARTYFPTMTGPSAKIQDQEMQIAMEEDVRENQIVMVKTAIAK